MPSKMTAVVGCFHFLAPRLLRRHVGHCAEGCAGARQVLGINRRSRRVNLRLAAGSNKDICRLDVAVSDPLAVRCVQPIRNLNRQVQQGISS